MLTESYTYDFAGNRASKTESDGSVTYYVNDVSETLTYVLAEYSEDDSSDVVVYVRGDELLLMERNNNLWYYIQDGHGNTEILLDEEANVTDRYVYDAYGNLLVREGSTENEFLYCGEQYNALIGLYYLRARYMNPATGTFISEDAYAGRMNEPVTLHKYLYAHANPVKYVDPSGYMSASFGETAGAALLVGVLVGGITIGTGMLRNMLASMMEDLESINNSLGVWIRYYIHQAAEKNAEDILDELKEINNDIEWKNKEKPSEDVNENTTSVSAVATGGNGHQDDDDKENIVKVKDNYLKKKGIDAHSLKRGILGKKSPIAQYDIYMNKNTGELYIYLKGGKGIGIPTGEFIK